MNKMDRIPRAIAPFFTEGNEENEESGERNLHFAVTFCERDRGG